MKLYKLIISEPQRHLLILLLMYRLDRLYVINKEYTMIKVLIDSLENDIKEQSCKEAKS